MVQPELLGGRYGIVGAVTLSSLELTLEVQIPRTGSGIRWPDGGFYAHHRTLELSGGLRRAVDNWRDV